MYVPTPRLVTEMRDHELFRVLELQRFVVVSRKVPSELFDAAAEAQIKAGLLTLEITCDSDDAFDHMRDWSKEPGVILGAGTVLDPWQVDRAVENGARFIVSPDCNPEVVAATLQHRVPSIPGCRTSTEITTAWRLGASWIKFHTGVSQGEHPEFEFVNTFTPLGYPALISGGVEFSNALTMLNAGAKAVAFNTKQFSPKSVANEIEDGIRSQIEKLSLPGHRSLRMVS